MSLENNQVCAELLLASLYELLPNTIPVGSDAWQWGFCVDCILETPLSATFLPELATHMQRLLKRGPGIRRFAMMRKNAIAFFQEKGIEYLVQRLEALQEGVVELCQIGEFYDIASFQEGKIPQEILLQEIEVQDGITRIYGAAFDSREQKKQYLKNVYRAVSAKAVAQKERLALYEGDHLTLLPQGVALWRDLQQQVTDRLRAIGYEEVIGSLATLLASVPKIYEIGFEENRSMAHWEPLYNDPQVLSCRFCARCTFDSLLEESTSLLKIFSEIARMVGLEYSAALLLPQNSGRKQVQRAKEVLSTALVSCGIVYHEGERALQPQVVLQVLDFRGRPQSIARLCVDLGESMVISGALPCSFGCLLALRIERLSGGEKV